MPVSSDVIANKNPNYVYPRRVILATIFGIPAMCLAVLVVEAAERWGYYGGAAINSIFLKDMYNYDASLLQLYTNFLQFWSYGTCLLGAYIADAWLGKTKTIAIFAAVYTVGIVLQALASMPFAFGDFPNESGSGPTQQLFWCGLVLIGLGTGGIKSNVGPLLSEQITDPTDEKTEMVFRYFYWAINLGAIGAYSVSPFVHRYDKDATHENGTTFYIAYWISAGVLITGMVIYMAFYRYYITSRVAGSPLARFFVCCWSAFKNRNTPSKVEDEEPHFIYHAEGYDKQELIDYRRIFSVCGLLIHYPTFWYLYGQNSNYAVVQGTYLDAPSWLTADQLGLVDPIAIVIMVPIFDRFVFPGLRKMGLELNIITRIAIGYVFMAASGACMVAIQLVLKANGSWDDDDNYTVDPDGNTYSVFWTIPSFFLCAIGEIFASITLNEFTYSQAPTSLKSVVFGLGLFTNCGSAIMGLIFSHWQTDANLAWFWLAFVGICCVQAVIIPWQFKNYKYRSVADDKTLYGNESEVDTEVCPTTEEITGNVSEKKSKA
eukprot:Nk52_evm30s1763 gene=Nk52_evmTU30s1763